MHRWIVLKFGGTSVSSAERWRTIESIARARIEEGFRPLIVCSAVRPVSNLLEQAVDAALAGKHQPLLDQVEDVHRRLASEMELDADELLGAHFEELRKLAHGISLVEHAPPRLRARMLAFGELMSTTLGAAYLRSLGLDPRHCDARELLAARREPNESERRHFLSASCDSEADEALQSELEALGGDVVVTQGFIVSDDAGETVLLGRGGSDTSAGYLAARLLAARLEIWTDVPGLFTANPREIEGARLIRRLCYNEAQEITTTGAKVLHPRCLEPLRRHGIPLHIRNTQAPEQEGTVISYKVEGDGGQVKALSVRTGLTLVSMETLGMWQQVGFLADVFSVFRRHGLSIDSVATSDFEVTVSLDPGANILDEEALERLVDDLSEYCKARVIAPCSSISLVGEGIRSLLHRLAPVLEAFEDQRVYLLTQAASDLNLTFIVDEEPSSSLLRKLHTMLFEEVEPDAVFGPTWREMQARSSDDEARPTPWWRKKSDALLSLAKEKGTPLYVYDEETLEESVALLRELPLDGLFYAMKANWNAEILSLFERAGLGFECVSPGEIIRLRELFPKLPGERILFTPNFAPAEEYALGFEAGANVTLDNLHPLRAWPSIFEGREILLRVDPGDGDGHHRHVRTAGHMSKFGVPMDELPAAAELAAKLGTKIVGLHAHAGSGILTPDRWMRTATLLAEQAQALIPDVRVLDVGGGLGIVEKPGQRPLDLRRVGELLQQVRKAHPRYRLWMEPGRFLVATAGVLLARATQRKAKEGHTYVGVDAGMNALLRPALYGAYHEIANLSRIEKSATERVDVVGTICETGDVLGRNRLLPPTDTGDVMLIATAGAYGRVMASEYNLRPPPAEHLLRR